MSRFTPQKATRKGQYARIAFDGPTGSGKTWTALQVATVLADGNPILLIDTERGSSQLYSDTYEFDCIVWDPPYDPRELRVEMTLRAKDYSVIVVDSATHFWTGEGGTLDIVESAAQRRFSGNSFAGWQEGTPAQNDLIDAFVTTPCHILVTMRSKMEYILDERNRPQKVGLAPIQRAGMEYEFTIVADMNLSHALTIGKSRFDDIADKVYNKGHSVEFAEAVRDWLGSAEALATREQVAAVRAAIEAIEPQGVRNEAKRAFKAEFGSPEMLSAERAVVALEWVTDRDQMPVEVDERDDEEESLDLLREGFNARVLRLPKSAFHWVHVEFGLKAELDLTEADLLNLGDDDVRLLDRLLSECETIIEHDRIESEGGE